MPAFLEFIKISNNWILTIIVYAVLIGLGIAAVRNAAKISKFIGEVKGELRKANWPWESDPKIKGFKKYRELVDSTVVVLIAAILLAGFVALWDIVHTQVVFFLTKLGG
jgi:preprotein translocase subunit SecE